MSYSIPAVLGKHKTGEKVNAIRRAMETEIPSFELRRLTVTGERRCNNLIWQMALQSISQIRIEGIPPTPDGTYNKIEYPVIHRLVLNGDRRPGISIKNIEVTDADDDILESKDPDARFFIFNLIDGVFSAIPLSWGGRKTSSQILDINFKMFEVGDFAGNFIDKIDGMYVTGILCFGPLLPTKPAVDPAKENYATRLIQYNPPVNLVYPDFPHYTKFNFQPIHESYVEEIIGFMAPRIDNILASFNPQSANRKATTILSSVQKNKAR